MSGLQSPFEEADLLRIAASTRRIPARKYDASISHPSHIQLKENGADAVSSKSHRPASARRRPRRLVGQAKYKPSLRKQSVASLRTASISL
jgi:hypothetical protein